MLHRFDTTDPTVPFAVPGVRWVPFYYCFDFRVNSVGYRLVSDSAMEVFFVENERNVSDREEWPADSYPTAFPRSPIKVNPLRYDPTDLEDAYSWAGVFGIDELSPANRLKARTRVAEEAELFGGFTPETDEEFRASMSRPFMQGMPNGNCLNPKCPARIREGQLSVVALVPAEPVKGVHTFGPYGSDVRLIFQLCPVCHAIRADNECT